MKLFIVRGLPGSGKSTVCKQVMEPYADYVFSTDDYWIRPDGLYDFNFKLLSEAHEWNYNNFTRVLDMHGPHVKTDTNNLFIDNTNVKLSDFEKYIDYFLDMGGKEVVLLEPNTYWRNDPEECAKRNTHGVPKETIERMLSRWEASYSIKNILEDIYLDIKVDIQ